MLSPQRNDVRLLSLYLYIYIPKRNIRNVAITKKEIIELISMWNIFMGC